MDTENWERRERMVRLSEEHERGRPGLWVLVFLALCLAVGLWLRLSVWNECRAAGHSRLYCWQVAGARS